MHTPHNLTCIIKFYSVYFLIDNVMVVNVGKKNNNFFHNIDGRFKTTGR